MRVFLDANILFSAAKSDGAVRELLRMLVERGHECCADAYVLAEARRNLENKGKLALDVLDALLALLHIAAFRPPPAEPHPADVTAWLPEKDRPVLSAAIALGCDALVTGDRTHFGPGYGRTFRGVTIYSSRSLAEYVLARMRHSTCFHRLWQRSRGRRRTDPWPLTVAAGVRDTLRRKIELLTLRACDHSWTRPRTAGTSLTPTCRS